MSTAVSGGLPPMSGVAALRARAAAGVVLCNAGDEVLEQQVSGIFYRFPPGERVEIRDREDWKRGKKGALLVNEPKVVLEGADAVSIAAEILSEEDNRLGNKGLTVLMGDEHDEERMRLARDRSMRYRIARAKQVQRAWILTCERASKDPGSLPPVQPENVRKEIAFLARYEAGFVDRKRFICKLDGAEFDARPELEAYIGRTYGQQVASAGGSVEGFIIDRDAAVPRPADAAPVVSAPAAPAPAEEKAPLGPSDPAWLIDHADKLGVNIVKAELVALIKGDKDVHAKVLDRVRQAAAKATGLAGGEPNGTP